MYNPTKQHASFSPKKIYLCLTIVKKVTDTEQRAQRLGQFLSLKKMKQTTLAQRIGVSRGFISQLISGNGDFTARFLNKMVECFPELNIDWLLRGEGDIFHIEKENLIAVSEPDAGYHANLSDPLSALRELLEDHNRRISALEARVEELMRKNSK